LPEDALREAIINAACHRDYFEKGARIMVEIFDDRVEIVSPGGVPKGITPENFGMISITRNSVIAGLLYRIDYIEEMGTGIRRMKNAAYEANVAEPEFELSGFFKVIFKRNELVSDNITDKKSRNVSDKKRDVRQGKLLELLRQNGTITVNTLAVTLKVSERTILRDLETLRNQERIKRIGSDTKGSWQVEY
jgi:ATP-dependent DNA helicase RecG